MPPRQTPRDLRASDADRERVVALLADAVGDGRLTPDEHAQRLEEATSARTLGDLAGLTTDLVGPDAQPVKLDGARPVLAVFGGQRREGRWVVPDRLPVTAVFGEAVLDLRDALLQSARTTIYATVIGGRLRLLVPDGVRVEVTGTGVGARERGTVAARGPRGSGARGFGSRGSGSRGSGAGGSGAGDLALGQSPVIEVRGLIVWGRIQAITPPKGRRFGIFPRRGR